ncbi:MAG: 50S ribosomal protein L2 [Planctomycetota bacterium]
MPIKTYKPYTKSRRFMTGVDRSDLTRTSPEKSLLKPLRKKGGRNFRGIVTARHRGGGSKRMYRVIDFKRDKIGIPGKVVGIEYDPNRSARIALVYYPDGEKRYILAPNDLKVGHSVISGEAVEIRAGNCMALRGIPTGFLVHNVEMVPGRGGQLARSAGCAVTLMAKEGDYANLQLSSGEVRRVHLNCRATIGQVGNLDHFNVTIGKAGRNRWKGWRPYVRGTAQSAYAHPMGGGEGRAHGGRPSCGPTGVLSKGGRTRRPKSPSQRFILQRRRK